MLDDYITPKHNMTNRHCFDVCFIIKIKFKKCAGICVHNYDISLTSIKIYYFSKWFWLGFWIIFNNEIYFDAYFTKFVMLKWERFEKMNFVHAESIQTNWMKSFIDVK